MKNSLFNVSVSSTDGLVKSITNNDDTYEMNWCSEEGEWGKIHRRRRKSSKGFCEVENLIMKFVSNETTDEKSVSVYKNREMLVTVTRYFNSNGNLVENYTIKNISGTVICINRDNFGIELPLPDIYSGAEECMIRRCNVHVWCGHDIAWVNALKMGPSDINLGLFLTKGAIECYEQDKCNGDSRGIFILNPESFMLKDGEEYEIEWELFWHKGTEDFMSHIKKYERYISVNAVHYTIFENEDIEFFVNSRSDAALEITLNGEVIPAAKTEKGYFVRYSPQKRGEHIFKIKIGEVETRLTIMVKIEFEKLLENRARFIIEKQQCLDPESPLYGAFLLYDNDYDAQYFDYFHPDHNVCRERMNIALFLMKYLQHKEDKNIRHAIDLYIDFVFREFYEEKTGEVFNTIGKNSEFLRLYNAPGVMLVLCEMYFVSKDEKYLKNIMKLADNYYKIGGKKCYANGLAIKKVICAFRAAGWDEEAEHLMELFQTHVDNIIDIGLAYPPHEVKYEQTIVTPAVQHISDMGTLREHKEFYVREARKHLECLERFSGLQPDYRLYETANRFWDDYWFGKSGISGDTFPHHLSCLTGRAYLAYAALSGEQSWIEKAENCIRDCMCLIDDDGRGHAAYVYPYYVNGERGDFLDSWSNDQDLVLYDALYASEYIDIFKI